MHGFDLLASLESRAPGYAWMDAVIVGVDLT
jgi:hypothetical protein